MIGLHAFISAYPPAGGLDVEGVAGACPGWNCPPRLWSWEPWRFVSLVLLFMGW